MPYIVTTTSGTTLATVPDNTVNTTTTSLALVGKNYAGYGSFLNENYIKLLENFNNSTAPGTPLQGQLWFDNASNTLKVYNGSTWKQVGTSVASSTAPSTPVTGDTWWDTANLLFKVWGGSSWVTIGPGTGGSSGGTGGSSSTTGALIDTIVDSTFASHVVVKISVNNNPIVIISKDAQFSPLTAIPGFANVYPGLNLVSSSTLTGSQFTGNVTNSQLLNNLSSSAFLQTNVNQSTSGTLAIVNNSGLTIGNTTTLTASSNASEFKLASNTQNKDLNLYVNRSGISILGLGISGSTGAITVNTGDNATAIINGGTNGSGNIGSSTAAFNTIFAKATTAVYADLAERFEADAIYEPGTVVELGGLKEITIAVKEMSNKVFGVISTAAAFLMNGAAGDDKTHPPVAMSGRVPVKVIGQVRKGDRLVAAGNGCARAATENEITPYNIIGRALADKYSDNEELVEAIVKINS